MFKVKRINHRAMDMNSYLLIKQDKVIVIDPGFNGPEIISYCQEHQMIVSVVLLTHGHYDHIRDIHLLKEVYIFDVYVQEKDLSMLSDPDMNYSIAFGTYFELDQSIKVNVFKDESLINLLEEEIKILYTPGHTYGSVMFEYREHIFSGDTLFYDSIGRTDLFSGNFNAIRKTINQLKVSLSNQKMIWPGHGKNGYFKDIKKSNRYLQ